ncbi:tryptophan-rich sensory protein [Bradyrhizobium sp.]|uniref:tryptophan-rich sensory protein n=1 Tax=Bradyrhizobium sp. TaxID=376 RepID=UPI002A30C8E4|nr:tryptophan-rich sensory protein [Bradyrhizobium sp.]
MPRSRAAYGWLRSPEIDEARNPQTWLERTHPLLGWRGAGRASPRLCQQTRRLAAIAAFIALQWRTDRIAALCFVPYAAWVAFATVLNWSIYRLN